MSGLGILFMVLTCSVVWGGFLLLLGYMLTTERRKAQAAPRGHDPE